MPQTLQACTRCRHEIESCDRFCQECGLAVEGPRLPGETSVKSAAETPAPAAFPHSAPDAAPPEAATRLSSPFLNITTAKTASNSIASFNFAVLDVLCLAVVLSFAGCLAWWMFTAQTKIEKAQIQSKLATAAQLYRQENYASAAATLERVQMFVKLPPANLDMLDAALIQTAKQALAQEKPKEALAALARVSHNSARYQEARIMELAIVHPPQAKEEPEARPPVRRRRFIPKISQDRVLSLPSLEELTGTNSESTPLPQADEATRQAPPAPKFSESEVSSYNRMLATFYSRSQEKDVAVPTFSEWLKSGKQPF